MIMSITLPTSPGRCLTCIPLGYFLGQFAPLFQTRTMDTSEAGGCTGVEKRQTKYTGETVVSV